MCLGRIMANTQPSCSTDTENHKPTQLLNERVDPVLAQASHEGENLHTGRNEQLEPNVLPFLPTVDGQDSQPMVLGSGT